MGATTSRCGELAIDKDGKFLALRTRNYANMGAYLSTFAPFIPTGAGTKVLASVYDFQAIHAHVLGVLTNTVPVDAYRGAGRPESNYLVERLIDAAARELGIDRDRAAPAQHGAAERHALHHRHRPALRQRRLPDGARRGAEASPTGPASRRAGPSPSGAASGAASASPTTWRPPAAARRSAPRCASPRTAWWRCWSAPRAPARATRRPTRMMTSHELGIPIEKIRIVQGDSDEHPDRRRHRRRPLASIRRARRSCSPPRR